MASAFRRKIACRFRGFRLQAEDPAAAEEWQAPCAIHGMAHPYPPHDSRLPYTGRHRYFLTFCTEARQSFFANDSYVALVRTQILRAAAEKGFEVTAYCFMPDHLHLITTGRDEAADVKAFIKLSKQYSGYYFKRETGVALWQRYGFERVIREDAELALTIRYILANPVQAGLVDHPAHYAHLGSQRHTVEELLAISEYDRSSV